jgi:hypothetical protein
LLTIAINFIGELVLSFVTTAIVDAPIIARTRKSAAFIIGVFSHQSSPNRRGRIYTSGTCDRAGGANLSQRSDKITIRATSGLSLTSFRNFIASLPVLATAIITVLGRLRVAMKSIIIRLGTIGTKTDGVGIAPRKGIAIEVRIYFRTIKGTVDL